MKTTTFLANFLPFSRKFRLAALANQITVREILCPDYAKYAQELLSWNVKGVEEVRNRTLEALSFCSCIGAPSTHFVIGEINGQLVNFLLYNVTGNYIQILSFGGFGAGNSLNSFFDTHLQKDRSLRGVVLHPRACIAYFSVGF